MHTSLRPRPRTHAYTQACGLPCESLCICPYFTTRRLRLDRPRGIFPTGAQPAHHNCNDATAYVRVCCMVLVLEHMFARMVFHRVGPTTASIPQRLHHALSEPSAARSSFQPNVKCTCACLSTVARMRMQGAPLLDESPKAAKKQDPCPVSCIPCRHRQTPCCAGVRRSVLTPRASPTCCWAGS